MAAPLIQGFPSLATPVASKEDLTLTIPWFQFLRALWERTGGGTGGFQIIEIDTGSGLTGGPANAAHPIVGFTLAPIGAQSIMANISGVAAIPTGSSLTDLLDALLGTVQGSLLFRNSTIWTTLPPGSAGFFLETQGPGADPLWAVNPGGTVTSISQGTGITLSPNPITSTGSVALATIADQRLLANYSGGAAAPTATTLTVAVDSLGSTQGNILYRNASAWTVLAPGTAGQVLQSGGPAANPSWATLAFGGRLLGSQIFSTAGASTYTPTTGTNFVVVELVGAGGGGGGCALTGAAQVALGGAGGGGGFARKLITTSFSGVTVTVGAKGTGGTAGANNGTAGGTTSFGALLSATGGALGAGGAAQGTPSAVFAGVGGAGSSGTPNGAGGAGSLSLAMSSVLVIGGPGGFSFFGAGAPGVNTISGSAGTAAVTPGGGGSGAANTASQGSGLAGGNGADGYVVVWEYT